MKNVLTPEQQQAAYREQCEYARKGATIITLATGRAQEHKSINAAKRWVATHARFKTYRK